SSDPATGRSKVTLISAVGMASPVGVDRMTRRGDGLCACVSAATHVVRTARASARRAAAAGMFFRKDDRRHYMVADPLCLGSTSAPWRYAPLTHVLCTTA